MAMRRREFLGATSGLLLSAGLPACKPHGATLPAGGAALPTSPFTHGVASGDPLTDRVVLWTRCQHPDSMADVELEWFCALEPGGGRVVRSGRAVASATRDHTVALDVAGLSPGTTYYYGFHALGWSSPIGRTRTAALDCSRARFAVTSCSNYSHGFFNGYRAIADTPELDAVLHLGDYIYEYEAGKYAASDLGRTHEPAHELVTLQDYRTRYAQYRSDPDLQAAHAAHPFIVIWDDHETANNSWLGGAKNHDEEKGEGRWQARLAAATRAYMEWLPIRPLRTHAGRRLYRSFRFGQLCDLFMLDGRIVGRDAQVDDRRDWAAVMASQRSMLGRAQEGWLYDGLAQSKRDGVGWRLLGQQTMVAQLRRADGIANDDQWDGYHAARERLFDAIEGPGIDNVVVLTGDIHSSWANELTREPWDGQRYQPGSGRGALATEIVCPGITSPSPYTRAKTKHFPAWIRRTHPHVRYLEGQHRGFVLLDVGPERLRAEWHLLKTVAEPSDGRWLDAAWEVPSGQARLLARDAGGPGRP